MTEPVHLISAAQTLERILNLRDPKHVYVVNIRPGESDDSRRRAAATWGNHKAQVGSRRAPLQPLASRVRMTL